MATEQSWIRTHAQELQGKCRSFFSGTSCCHVPSALIESRRRQFHKVSSCHAALKLLKSSTLPNREGGAQTPGNPAPACSASRLQPLPHTPGLREKGSGYPADCSPSVGNLASLHHLFSISTGSASGGCTFTFTSAMKAVFETRGKVAPRSALEVSGTGGGARRGGRRERGEGPSSSGRAGPSSSDRLGVPVLCLLHFAQRGRHNDSLLLSPISVLAVREPPASAHTLRPLPAAEKAYSWTPTRKCRRRIWGRVPDGGCSQRQGRGWLLGCRFPCQSSARLPMGGARFAASVVTQAAAEEQS